MQDQYLDIQKFNINLAKWVFPVLILLSIIFYQERTLFLDNAFQMFLLIQDGYPRIMTNRWPALVLRLLPWVGFSIGLSLKSILILFSVSFPLFHSLLWYLISIKAKAHDLGLLLMGMLTIGVCDTFYWCPSDLTQATAVVLLFIAVLRRDHFSFAMGILLILLAAIALFMHPLCIFPLGFLIIYDGLIVKKIQLKTLIVLGSFILFWWLKSKFFTNWYDIAKQEDFYDHLAKYKYQLWSIPSNTSFLTELLTKYYLLLLLSISVCSYLVYHKQFIKVFAVLGASIIYVLIVHLGHPMGDNSFYREASYMVLTVFILYPILQILQVELSPLSKVMKYGIYVLMMLSLIKMILYHKDYTVRVHKIRSIITESCDKQIINENSLNKDIFKMNWAISTESLLISHLDGTDKTLSLRKSDQAIQDSIFMGPFLDYHYDELNQSYFRLKSGLYCD